MSRSDGWSIAATLFGTGIAYFIGGGYTAYGAIVISVVIAAFLLLTKKKTVQGPGISQSQQANPTMTARPKMKQEANPKFENNQTIIGSLHLLPPAPESKPERRPIVRNIGDGRLRKIADDIGAS